MDEPMTHFESFNTNVVFHSSTNKYCCNSYIKSRIQVIFVIMISQETLTLIFQLTKYENLVSTRFTIFSVQQVINVVSVKYRNKITLYYKYEKPVYLTGQETDPLNKG